MVPIGDVTARQQSRLPALGSAHSGSSWAVHKSDDFADVLNGPQGGRRPSIQGSTRTAPLATVELTVVFTARKKVW